MIVDSLPFPESSCPFGALSPSKFLPFLDIYNLLHAALRHLGFQPIMILGERDCSFCQVSYRCFFPAEIHQFRAIHRPICANRRGTSLHQRIMAQRLEIPCQVPVNADTDHFETLKQRFLNFKEQKYMKNIEQYSKLASEQNPTYMVIACGDSRVCPSTILGFEPGEAFIIRNIANLVPPYEETDLAGTSAAVEFAVLTLKVQRLIIIGHSCCGGIRALMSMPDEEAPPSGFIEKWVSVAKPARQRTKVAAGNLPFDDQCSHCEKVSINQSLSNLFTFPFIKDLMAQKKLALHGGYYNFVNCSFEIWSLSSEAANAEDLKPEIVQYSQWS